MENNGRVVELLTEMLIEQKNTNKRLDNLEISFRNLETQQSKTNVAIKRLERRQAITNLTLSEMRTSFMRIADKLDTLDDHERRIRILEHK